MPKFIAGDIVLYADEKCEVIGYDDVQESPIVRLADGSEEIVKEDDLEKFEDVSDEDIEEVDEEVEDLDETKAADTLKTHGNFNPEKLVTAMTQSASHWDKSDQMRVFRQMMDMFGKNKAPGMKDHSGENKSSVKMKPSDASASMVNAKMPSGHATKEELIAILGKDELSEELQEKIATLFEAQVNAAVMEQVAAHMEDLEKVFTAAAAEEAAKIEENVAKYLDYVCEEWIKENHLAIEQNLKTEIAESFITGFKQLCTEHYIDIDDEKVEVIEKMAEKIEDLEEKINEEIKANMELTEAIEEHNLQNAFDEVCTGLADTQSEKLEKLCEGIEFSDLDDFKKKANFIKEAHFGVKGTTNMDDEVVTEEEKELKEEVKNEEEEESKKPHNPFVRKIFESLND